MKNHPAPNRRAFAALIPATLLLAAPAFAQEVPAATAAPPAVQVAPPTVVPTVSEPAAVAPTVVLPTIAPTPPAAAEAPAPTATRTARAVSRTTRVTHAAAAPVTRAPAAAAAAPAPVAPAPVAVTPAEPAPVQVAPAPVEAVAPPPAAPAATTETTTTEQPATWPWVLAGLLVVLGAIGLFVMRRRRADVDEAIYEEPYVEPVAQHAPIVAPAPIVAEPAFAPARAPEFLRTAPLAADTPAPTASEDATLAEPEAAEVAELTAGDAPVADRPWLEFALRPIRAGISADEALVEFELTVGNSGSVKAKDVRISTFLFASEPGSEAEMERMLIERGDGHEDGVSPVTIEPGEGARVDATLALPKAQLIETTNGSILPVIIAYARYTLADGTEGRTSASFTIGVSEEGTPAMSPLSLADRGMHDEVEARLCGVPEHA